MPLCVLVLPEKKSGVHGYVIINSFLVHGLCPIAHSDIHLPSWKIAVLNNSPNFQK